MYLHERISFVHGMIRLKLLKYVIMVFTAGILGMMALYGVMRPVAMAATGVLCVLVAFLGLVVYAPYAYLFDFYRKAVRSTEFVRVLHYNDGSLLGKMSIRLLRTDYAVVEYYRCWYMGREFVLPVPANTKE